MLRLLFILFIFGSASAQTPMSFLLTKPAASGPTVYLQDLFTGSDGTNLTSHTMNVGSGWTKPTNGPSCSSSIDMTIQSNTAQPSAGAYSIYWADAGVSDGNGSLDLIIPNTGNYIGGIIFRYVSCSSWSAVIVERDGSGTPYMYIADVNGGFSLRASVNVPGATNSTLNIKVTLSGNSIVALAGTGETCNYSTSYNATATKFGIFGYDASPYTPAIPVDNFLVTN